MIERNINGVVDFCIAKVEEIDGRDDMDIEKKSRMMLAFFKEVRGYMTANLAYKKLLITAPDVAKNAEIELLDTRAQAVRKHQATRDEVPPPPGWPGPSPSGWHP